MTPISELKDLKDKRVLVVGVARSGVSMVHFLTESGAQVTVSDHKSKAELAQALEQIEGLPNLQFDFASWFIKEPVIAVTGTNGKSTTCKLIETFLTESGVKCWLGGNYGDAL